jgi:diacylglycerol O-acyltransferase / wax synthase
MQRLSGLDASFLYFETSSQLLHVCGIIMLDTSTMPGGYSFDSLLHGLEDRVQDVPEFRRKLHRVPLGLDHPVWVEDPDFDIDHHVHRIGCPSPGGDRELAEICGHIAGQPLDRSRPLWEMWVIEGLADGKVAVMSKMHHATVDGVSGANMIAYLCSLEPEAPPLEQGSEEDRPRRPGDVELVGRAVLNLARRPWNFAKVVAPAVTEVVPEWVVRATQGRGMPAPFTAPRTPFNSVLTGHRSVAFTDVALDDVKEVKKAFGGTVNDVVMAVCSGALRTYLRERGELPASSLVAMVPVSVHGRSDIDEGSNKITGMFAKLRTDVADPVERLRQISDDNVHAKEHVNAIDADILQDWARFAAPRTFGLAVRVYSGLRLPERHPPVYNLVVSNVPGPPVPLYFLGARIEGLYPLGPVFHGAGANITVMSNDGRLNVGIIACRELLPRQDIWALADAMPAAMDELLTAARAEHAAATTGPAEKTARKKTARKKTAPKQTAPKQTGAEKPPAKKSPAKTTTTRKAAEEEPARPEVRPGGPEAGADTDTARKTAQVHEAAQAAEGHA